ncbi:hypothetical protein P9D36_03515 [Bacillus haynesii]|uniref:hypothetical protein n=1 Tax=Bacillus haynesii TaxID=1925021 RepID=UPI001593D7FA|nr:hypothetical protein [Bacillus haynesii]NVB33899.1 hypothetical protein [Bacillus licheniformis]MCY7777725.1 hypothetical protein [Bacillus haynesii]MCY7816284.1 hypothetical protein [Bacillus haynesii]MCY8223226.1 hypothetical protein [Bacillus haynesii]MCY8240690.1 hypothetical protein [Bacillus haynesii]
MANDDFFTKMMFGANAPGRQEEEPEAETETAEDAEVSQEADYMHVLNQVGQIMDSIDELKPVFKEIGSMVSALKNKI